MGVAIGVHARSPSQLWLYHAGGQEPSLRARLDEQREAPGKPSAQELSSPGQRGAGAGAATCPRRTTGCLGTLGHSVTCHTPQARADRQMDGQCVGLVLGTSSGQAEALEPCASRFGDTSNLSGQSTDMPPCVQEGVWATQAFPS